LLTSVSATCRSEDRNELISIGINYKDTNVVNEGNIITANGPLSAELFAETILNMIK
jgi:putative intracellular protease/amidase